MLNLLLICAGYGACLLVEVYDPSRNDWIMDKFRGAWATLKALRGSR